MNEHSLEQAEDEVAEAMTPRKRRAQKAGQRTATLDGQKAAFDVPEGTQELLPFWFGPEGQEMRAVAVLGDGTRVTLKATKGG